MVSEVFANTLRAIQRGGWISNAPNIDAAIDQLARWAKEDIATDIRLVGVSTASDGTAMPMWSIPATARESMAAAPTCS